MIWFTLMLGCSCGEKTSADAARVHTPGPQPRRPAILDTPANPKKLAKYPKCVAYGNAICEVCGAKSDACASIKTVNAICSDRGTCQEASCAKGEQRVRSDPAGKNSELCTE